MISHVLKKHHFSTEKNVWVAQILILSSIKHQCLVLIAQKTHTLYLLCIVVHLVMKKTKTPHKHRNQKKMDKKTKPNHKKKKIKHNKRKRSLTTKKTKLQEMRQKIKLDKLQMWQTMKLHKISHKLQTPQTPMFSTKLLKDSWLNHLMISHVVKKHHFSTENNVWVAQILILSSIKHLWLVLIVQKTHTLFLLYIVVHLAMKKIKLPQKTNQQPQMLHILMLLIKLLMESLHNKQMIFHVLKKLHFSTEKSVWVAQILILSLIKHLWLVPIVPKIHTLFPIFIAVHLVMSKIKMRHKHPNHNKTKHLKMKKNHQTILLKIKNHKIITPTLKIIHKVKRLKIKLHKTIKNYLMRRTHLHLIRYFMESLKIQKMIFLVINLLPFSQEKNVLIVKIQILFSTILLSLALIVLKNIFSFHLFIVVL